MREGFSSYQTWPFECLHCLRVWEEEYLVRHVSDGHGNDAVVWTRDGIPVQPPWSGTICPWCGCGSVTTFPIGYLARHPERPRATGQVPPSRASVSRSPLASATLLTMSLLSLLLLTGVDVYQRVHAP